MNSIAQNLACDNQCEYPIEQLFKSIFILQPMIELEKEVERLSKKLHKYLMKIPEKEGVRTYENVIKYYPNGLCEWFGRTVILPGYTSTYEPPEPKPKETPEEPKKKRSYQSKKRSATVSLRESYLFWYAQLREHQNKNYTISKSYRLNELLKKKEIYDGLSKEEQKLLDKEHDFSYQFESFGHALFYEINHYSSGNSLKLPMLMEDELELLEIACEKAQTKYDQRNSWSRVTLSYYVRQEMKEFVENLDLHRKGRIIIDLSKGIKIVNRRYETKRWDPKTQEYVPFIRTNKEHYYTSIMNCWVEEIEKIEDETVLQVFEKLGLLPHSKNTSKKQEKTAS